MDGRHARLVDPVLDRVPGLKRIAPVPPVPARVSDRLAAGWAGALGVGWLVAYVVATALEPVPDDPEAGASLLASLVGVAFMVSLCATWFLAGRRLPSAAIAGSVTGVIAVAMSAMCPVSGHHHLGLWWVGQLGVLAGMLGVSLVAFGRRSRTLT